MNTPDAIESAPTDEPTIVSAAIRHPLIFLVTSGVIFFALFTYLLSTSGHSSEVRIQVQDARTATLLDSAAGGSPQLYVDDQVAILTTPAVALEAHNLAVDELGDAAPESTDILSRTTVSKIGTSSVISVKYSADQPDLAEMMTTLVVKAYQGVKLAEALRGYESALGQIDILIAGNTQLVADLTAEIESISGQEAAATIELRFREAVQRLVNVDDATEAATPEAASLILSQISAVQQEISAIERALAVIQATSQVSGLSQRQNAAIGRLSGLIETRDRLALEAQLAGAGVVFESPATPPSRDMPVSLLGLVAILAVVAGLVTAYARALRD